MSKDKQADDQSELDPDIMNALRAQAKREVDMIVIQLRRLSVKELEENRNTAELNADYRLLGVIKHLAPITAKRENDRLLIASRRACEACERSGTPQQLADEQALLSGYEARRDKLASAAATAEKDLPSSVEAMLETRIAQSVARTKRRLRDENAA